MGVDNHHMQLIIIGKGLYFGELFGVIDKVLYTLTLILSGKVVTHHLKTLLYAFTNGNTRYYYDKLTPAILPIEFVHGFDIGIGLACPCFHLYSQLYTLAFQCINRLYILYHL